MTEDKKIRDVLKDVETAFSRLDIAAWLQCFHSPRIIVLPDALFSPSSEAECRTMMGPYFDSLRERGFNRSNLDKCNIQFLTDTTAIASTAWSRFDGEDNLIEQLGATYLFLKTDDLWRITMVTLHSADVMVIQG